VFPAALPSVHFFGRGTITMLGTNFLSSGSHTTQGMTAAGAVFAPCGIVPAAAEVSAEI
jgi:hypothetical protein